MFLSYVPDEVHEEVSYREILWHQRRTLYDILVKYVAFLQFIDQALHISGSKSMVYDVEVCNELFFSHSARSLSLSCRGAETDSKSCIFMPVLDIMKTQRCGTNDHAAGVTGRTHGPSLVYKNMWNLGRE